MSLPSAVGRPADRRMEIVRQSRQQIVGGTWAPGSQLPSRVEIESRFGVSPVTVQRALENLRDDGFVTVNGRQGTYVSENPPHLNNFALVFPYQPNSGPWVRFWTALNNEAATLSLPPAQKLTMYHNINPAVRSTALDDLSREVTSHRVAGLIFASSPHPLEGTPILDEPGIPRVSIQSYGADKPFPIVHPDRDAFLLRAMEYLRSRGRMRLAGIGPPRSREMQPAMLDLVREQGFETRPYWWLGVGAGTPESARNCAHLLMNPGQPQRPDALIISDDNLVEHALSGLLAAGVRVPEDLEIVAHCNFPWPASSVLPLMRLGFDSRQILTTCIEIINQQRAGQEAPPVSFVSPVFENEGL